MSAIKDELRGTLSQMIAIEGARMKREDLEQQALKAVCACWYYDLADNIEVASDSELLAIVERDRCVHCE